MPPRQEAGSGLLGFLFVLVVPILLAAVLVPAFCVHKVEEGHIGACRALAPPQPLAHSLPLFYRSVLARWSSASWGHRAWHPLLHSVVDNLCQRASTLLLHSHSMAEVIDW